MRSPGTVRDEGRKVLVYSDRRINIGAKARGEIGSARLQANHSEVGGTTHSADFAKSPRFFLSPGVGGLLPVTSTWLGSFGNGFRLTPNPSPRSIETLIAARAKFSWPSKIDWGSWPTLSVADISDPFGWAEVAPVV